MTPPLLILVAGDPVPPTQARAGGFANLVRTGLAEVWGNGFVEVDARTAESLPAAAGFAGVIVTGACGVPSDSQPREIAAENVPFSLLAPTAEATTA